ncbi:transcriptional regulator SlyA [Vibrio mangrovi]|uniref:Transcriptional regulator SlyA n=1 Tax=Vibrio mangrovi TaxID=474394 RepID=A0A1Y6IVR2_9VIBR|nr:transcriptional regulator SlyA [Vibrio mangrovi]MDW6004952.1 transcriptional regulator SlyA [Vibrio mangrovi]SMS01716.1 Transcriptional regulator SlyA [Vibrio mangrovi]
MVDNLNILKNLSLAEQLARVARLWKSAADQELAPLGLTQSRWVALWKLQRLGDNISQKALADALEIELGSLMRTLKLLEEQNLIERHCCSYDKRARIVRLTDDGKAILKQIEEKVLHVRRCLLSNIDEAELSQLSQTLEKIAHNAQENLNQPE